MSAPIDTTKIGAVGRQPGDVNYLSGVKFSFRILKLPNVTYFCQSVNIPSISLAVAETPTPLGINIAHGGNKMTFNELTVTFMVDENLQNYVEIFNWITGLGHPKDLKQYSDLKFGDPRALSTFGGLLSDCMVHLLDSDSNPNMNVHFINAFPISLTGLDLDSRSTDTEYQTATVNFRYDYFEYLPVK